MPEEKRPEHVKDEHLTFLDALRAGGEVNMFGALPWLRGSYSELSRKEASEVLSYWMRTVVERHPVGGGR